jgi:hypothetical protein
MGALLHEWVCWSSRFDCPSVHVVVLFVARRRSCLTRSTSMTRSSLEAWVLICCKTKVLRFLWGFVDRLRLSVVGLSRVELIRMISMRILCCWCNVSIF